MSPYVTKTLEFIMDLESNQKYAALTVASGALIVEKMDGTEYNKNDVQTTPIALKPYPDSLLVDLVNNIKPKYWDHTQKLFPLYDGKTLPFHLTVRSTVLDL